MKINEVSEKFKLSPDTLRYYEKIGLIEEVKREGGIRNYQEADMVRINFILCMKDAGLSLDDIREYIGLHHQGEDTLEQRLEILEQQKTVMAEKMTSMQKTIDYLDYKIGFTEEKIEKREHQKITIK